LLALMHVGEGSPALEVIVFMIGASLASAAHLTKAGTRLLVQMSPEPFSNVAISFVEDIFAIGYTYLTLLHPQWSFFLTLLLMIGVVTCVPVLYRAVSMAVRSLGWRIAAALGAQGAQNPSKGLPIPVEVAYEELREEGEEVLWAGKVFAIRLPGVPRYKATHLILSNRAATFFYQRFFHRKHKRLLKDDVSRTVVHSKRLLALCIFWGAGSPWMVGLYRSLAGTLPSLWFPQKS